MIRHDLQSRTINLLRLIFILFVVFIHAYTSTRNIVDASQFPVYKFISFLISLNIAEVAIPGFFFISGYLYFYSTNSYTDHLRKDWRRLVIPYLMWNTMMIFLYWIMQGIPSLSTLFSGDNLPIRDYSVVNFLKAYLDCGDWDGGNGTPILHQFWYIRNLILLGILSPVIRQFVKWTGLVGVGALVAWWIVTPDLGLMPKSLAFFSAGAWFALRRPDLLSIIHRYRWPIITLYIASVVIRMVFWDEPWSILINRFGGAIGIMFFTLLMAWIIEHCKRCSADNLSGLIFFIYAAHDPLSIFIKRFMLSVVPHTDFSMTVIYIFAPIVVVGLCTLVYYMIKYTFPRLLFPLVGMRAQ